LIQTRPATAADADAVLELITACDIADVGQPDFTLDDLRDEWANPEVDLAADSLLVEAADGGVAAYTLCTSHAQDVYVHPAHLGEGVGSALLPAVERRAGEQRFPLRQYIAGRNRRGADLLARNGYRPTHHYWRMALDLTAPPAAAVLPEGVELRPFRTGTDDRVVHALVQAAFSEIEGNIHHDWEQWRIRSIDTSSFDARWWFIAWAGNEIAGVALSEHWAEDDTGWVGQLAVAPEWRGRGLGRALLLTALSAFHAAGVAQGMLSVHGDNDRAARLYESVGMRQAWRHDRYEKRSLAD
jgi:mycothiol synthase